MIWEIILSVQNELYLNSITSSMPDLEFKFHILPTNLYNLINLKFKSSAFQFSFKISTNFPDNPIEKSLLLTRV